MSSRWLDDPMAPALVRVVSGAATPADEADVRAWLAAGPDRARELEELRAIWRQTASRETWDTSALQRRILGALDTKVVPLPVARPEGETSALPSIARLAARRSSWWWMVAAAAAIVAMAGVVRWRPGVGTAPAAAEPALTEVATRRAQRATLQLSDGTRITLGVDSRLRYPESFARGASRDVYLEGEAYFEVAHDATRPFRVYAGDAVTRVLGTRFGVRAYSDERGVQVAVAEGRVALGHPGADASRQAVLTRGDVGTLAIGGMPIVRHGADVASQLAWVEGRLVFVDTPLRDVVRRLSRWYDLDVRLGDRALDDEPYTMSLRGDESPEHVLRIVAAAVGARLERRGEAYVMLTKPVPTR